MIDLQLNHKTAQLSKTGLKWLMYALEDNTRIT